MQKHPELTERRIAAFIERELAPRLHGAPAPLALEVCARDLPDRRAAAGARFVRCAPGYRWGPVFSSRWFRARGAVPAGFAGRQVVAMIDVGAEATVWDARRPVGGFDREHRQLEVAAAARGGEKVELWLQAYGADPGVSVSGRPTDPGPTPFEVRRCELRTFDADLWQLLIDVEFRLELLRGLPEGSLTREHLRRALNDAVNAFVPGDAASVARARALIRQTDVPAGGGLPHELTPVGHAHLDTAWLWPLRTSVHKMAHTAANQLALLARYPEYTFVHGQAVQYAWLEERYPALFAAVKDAVAAGRWEPVGALWVEADVNLASGESLVRQVLHGKRWFAERFGADMRVLWLPDTFGYSAALPQILREAGIEGFCSQKLSWNQFNRFPHNTFFWQGIDGSRVFAHFPPADTYNGDCGPDELRRHITHYQDHGRSDAALYVFGHGDGGGGPEPAHLERLRRAERAPGMPRVRHRSVAEFFERARAAASEDLPVWVGELYFEMHRGTLTTQAHVKRGNRAAEARLRDAELLCSFDRGRRYPAAELEALWKTTLLHQFHDILPGSSVRAVYEDTWRDHAEVIAGTEAIARAAIARIAGGKPRAGARTLALYHGATAAAEGRIAPLPRGRPVRSIRCGEQTLPVQEVAMFGERALVFAVPEAARGAVARAELLAEPAPATGRLRASRTRLESDRFLVRLDRRGHITSIVARDGGGELVAPGERANVIELFDDRPLDYDAWDVDAFALETGRPVLECDRVEVVEQGPVRAAVEVERRIGAASRIVQRISLGPTPGIRFDTWVDWREEQKLLKVAFPVAINAERARYGIQHGHVERPTHRNTSWDVARFEVCAHGWVDLAEGGRGVALLDDGKYGHDVLGNVMRLTLLRAPLAPDPTADRGTHRFTYALLPHRGSYAEAGVVAASRALDAPVWAVGLATSKSPPRGADPLVCVDDDALVIEAVKRACDSDALIVRLHEPHNARGRTRLRVARPFERATRCDLLENDREPLDVHDGAVTLDFRPFELITVKLR